MKTKTQVLKNHSEYKTLINAVISRVGLDSVEDVNNHGIDGGFGGFIYYADTNAFFRRHKKDIMRMAQALADDLREDLLSMIQNFKCLGKDFSQTEIAESLFGNAENNCQIRNTMAWFAAEEVCRMFEN